MLYSKQGQKAEKWLKKIFFHIKVSELKCQWEQQQEWIWVPAIPHEHQPQSQIIYEVVIKQFLGFSSGFLLEESTNIM